MQVVLTMSLTASCASPTPAAPEQREQKPMNSERELKVNGKIIRVNESDLEAIRQAVVSFLATRDDDFTRTLKEELQHSIAVVGPEDSRLGPWALSDREDGLVLVRIPARGAVNHLFVAKLSLEDGHWRVTDFFQERMNAR